MALIREAPAFPLVAAFAGVVWTVSAAELWVAAQLVERAVRGEKFPTLMFNYMYYCCYDFPLRTGVLDRIIVGTLVVIPYRRAF
jgi:hypothetical protein